MRVQDCFELCQLVGTCVREIDLLGRIFGEIEEPVIVNPIIDLQFPVPSANDFVVSSIPENGVVFSADLARPIRQRHRVVSIDYDIFWQWRARAGRAVSG